LGHPIDLPDRRSFRSLVPQRGEVALCQAEELSNDSPLSHTGKKGLPHATYSWPKSLMLVVLFIFEIIGCESVRPGINGREGCFCRAFLDFWDFIHPMVTTHALPEPVLRECGLRKYRRFPAEQAEPLCVTRTDWGQGLLDGFILASNTEGRFTCKSIYLSIYLILSIYLSTWFYLSIYRSIDRSIYLSNLSI